MSSYTKTLMERAAVWLSENPDADDPFLRVPEYQELRRKQVASHENAERLFRKAVSIVGKNGSAADEVSESLGNLFEKTSARIVAHNELEESISTVESIINKNYVGASKIETHEEILGRFLLAWARTGYNVLELSPDFVAAMLLTDSREIDISRTLLPFKGFLMLIPDGFARDAEGRSYTKIHVSEVDAREAMMLDTAENIDKELGELPRSAARKVLSKALHDSKSTPAWINNSTSKLTQPPAVARVWIHASCGPHGFNFAAKRDTLSWSTIDLDADDLHSDDATVCLSDVPVINTILMLVFSTLAYINAVKTAVEPVHVSKTKRKSLGNSVQPTRWTVGRTIKLDPQLVQVARAGRNEITFRLKHRHFTRGHFRNQAHGPNHTLRKEIYIQGFWKGPEEGAKLVHTYKPVTKLPALAKPVEVGGACVEQSDQHEDRHDA